MEENVAFLWFVFLAVTRVGQVQDAASFRNQEKNHNSCTLHSGISSFIHQSLEI